MLAYPAMTMLLNMTLSTAVILLARISKPVLYVCLPHNTSLHLQVVKVSHYILLTPTPGTAIAQWLRCCGTNQKVAGSIPAGVSGFSFDIKSLRSHYGPGVDSTSNRNEYREYFLGVKATGA